MKNVDILKSKNQVLQILYYVYNHYLYIHSKIIQCTVINSIKLKLTFNNNIAEMLIIFLFFLKFIIKTFRICY